MTLVLAESFTYDASGNMLTYGSNNRFAYDARGRRTVAYTGAVGTVDQVNGLGQRVASQEPTGVSAFANAFAYDEAGHLIGRYGSNGAVIDERIWLGDLPIAIYTLAGPTYIAPDHLGSPHQMTNGSNAQVWFWDHDPFGNGAPTSTFTENLRFPGQYHDSGTGFAYNYFRDYDPATGRYIESDPIGLQGGVNTYAYVGGNPLTRVDWLGLRDYEDPMLRIAGRAAGLPEPTDSPVIPPPMSKKQFAELLDKISSTTNLSASLAASVPFTRPAAMTYAAISVCTAAWSQYLQPNPGKAFSDAGTDVISDSAGIGTYSEFLKILNPFDVFMAKPAY